MRLLPIICLLAGCGLFEPRPPVPEDVMTRVLVDVLLVDARGRRFADISPEARDSVLAAYGLDERRFERALLWYVEHSDPFNTVYSGVVDSLMKLDVVAPEEMPTDSLTRRLFLPPDSLEEAGP